MMTAAEHSLHDAKRDLRFYRLTPRWTQLKPHRLQQLFVYHPALIKINPSGRRSGKTELGKRKAVMQLVKRRPWPAKILIGAPTFDQVRTIYWDDMKLLIPPHWISSINETRLEITMKWGAMLRLVGLDKPQRIEGTPWDWILIDEIADCPPRCFNRNIMPALSTLGRKISADLIGVPDEVGRNQTEYEEMYELGLRWNPGTPTRKADGTTAWDPDICSFHWRSADILEPDKIAALRARMDAMEFEQEYGGRFLTSGGKAVPRFDRQLHVSEYFSEYCPRLPLDWTLDFGVTPAASLLCQSYKGHVWVMDEIVIDDGSTEAQEEAFRKRIARGDYDASRFIRLFGDAAGNQRHSPIGVSDYDILEARLKDLPVQWEQLDAAPLVKDSLNAVRCRVATSDNMIHLHIHPRCQKLINDMKTAPWPDKDQLRQFHCLAALRYYCYRLFGEGTGGYSTEALRLPNTGGATTANR